MRLRLHISPCPNDTFMFDAMVNGRIDTCGITFEVFMEDIESLNDRLLGGAASGENSDTASGGNSDAASGGNSDAASGGNSDAAFGGNSDSASGGTADVSKVSCAILPSILSRYRLLDSGSALGRGNGPVLVARGTHDTQEFGSLRVAIPGRHTTANLLLSALYPQITDKREYVFSQVAGAVAGGEADAGVLIHEGRFTYRERGLRLLADLGEKWEESTGLPLPLGCIVASRALDPAVRDTVERLLRESVDYAMRNPSASRDFVRAHAREMNDDVIDKHIKMFVTGYSLSLGDEGRDALCRLTNLSPEQLFS